MVSVRGGVGGAEAHVAKHMGQVGQDVHIDFGQESVFQQNSRARILSIIPKSVHTINVFQVN